MANEHVLSQVITDVEKMDLSDEFFPEVDEATAEPSGTVEDPAAPVEPTPKEPKEATEPKEDTTTEPTPEEPAPKEDAEAPKEEATTDKEPTEPQPDKKISSDEFLSKLLTPEEAPVEPRAPETEEELTQLTVLQQEVENLRADKVVREEADAIITTLEKLNDEEAAILRPEVLKLTKSPTYIKLTKAEFTPEEKAATLIAMAIGTNRDKLKAATQEAVEKAVEVKNKKKEVASFSSNKESASSEGDAKKALVQRANDGDQGALGDILFEEFGLEDTLKDL